MQCSSLLYRTCGRVIEGSWCASTTTSHSCCRHSPINSLEQVFCCFQLGLEPGCHAVAVVAPLAVSVICCWPLTAARPS